MAEEFVNRLNQIQATIEAVGETLKRMITILGTITEVQSEVRQAKTEIIAAIPSAAPTTDAPAPAGPSLAEIQTLIKQEVGTLAQHFTESITILREEMQAAIQSMPAASPAPVAAPAVVPAVAPAVAPAVEPTPPAAAPVATPEPAVMPMGTSLPADKAMAIAGYLDQIVKSLKMGCKSGAVQDSMTEAKELIMKIVPSDPIMIKIDKWMGVVSAYPKRKELQARDILKLKKELKAEIQAYYPA
ncbi:MAG: hypothetical protein RTU92_00725 [Candidatus Thorarchaeota archaeon]